MRNEKIDDRFAALYALTLTICNLWSAPPTYREGGNVCWVDLADIWKTHGCALGCDNVFVPALHKIYWGVYPDGVSGDALLELLGLIEVELLSNGPAYKVWKYRFEYRIAFQCIVSIASCADKKYGPKIHTRTTEHYLYCRTFNAVVYKDAPPCAIDLVTASNREIRSARTQAQIHAYCHGFEHVIKKLLPQSRAWTHEQWSDDRYIMRGLKKTFDVNYLKHEDAYDELMDFLVHQWYYGVENNLGRILCITYLPFQLVEVIWPKNTAEEVENMFLKAYQRIKSVEGRKKASGVTGRRRNVFSYERMKKNWLYAQVQTWVYNNAVSEKNRVAVKRAIFELSLI